MTNQPSETKDHLLVLRAQLGQEEALRALFTRYNGRLLYYLRRIVGDDAEDALQEVWVKVLRNLNRIEKPGAFKAWIYRTAHNQAISRLRSQRIEVGLDELAEEPVAPSTVDDSLLVFRDYESLRIHQGLESLSAPHREVITLRFLEELSYEDIASVVGCSVGTVRSRLHYAKHSLLQALQPVEQEPNP